MPAFVWKGKTRDGKNVYGLSSIGRDKSALTVMEWETGAEQVLAEHPKADIWGLLAHPETFVAEAAAAEGRLSPSSGVMMQAVWFDAGAEQSGRLWLSIHHLAVDGVSWRILLPDLAAA